MIETSIIPSVRVFFVVVVVVRWYLFLLQLNLRCFVAWVCIFIFLCIDIMFRPFVVAVLFFHSEKCEREVRYASLYIIIYKHRQA